MKKITEYLSLIDILSFSLAIIGLILGNILTPYFYLLSAVAIFLPILLRNTGILNDKDEYQLETLKLSGNTAFCIGGILAFMFAIGFKTGIINTQQLKQSELWGFFVVFLLLIYMINYTTRFWGSSRGARIILITSGLFWCIFVLFSGWGNTYALGIGLPVISTIFFGLPALSLKWPKTSGVILVFTSLFFILFLTTKKIKLIQLGSVAVITLLLFPILISGFVLINRDKGEEE